MAEQSRQQSELELSQRASPESLLHLKNLSMQRMANLMKQSAQELDDMISNNIKKLDVSINRIKRLPPKVKKISNISSSGDGETLEILSPSKLEKDDGDNCDEMKSDILEKIPTSIPNPPSEVTAAVVTEVIFNKSSSSLFNNSTPIRPLVAASSTMGKITSEMAISRINLKTILDNYSSAFQTDTNVNERNIYVVKSTLRRTPDATILDFRTLNNWLERPASRKSQLLVIPRTIEELTKSTTEVTEPAPPPTSPACPVDFTPPNEFDWFSFENMNTVLPLSAASKVLAIVKESHCLDQLKEFYINATSSTDEDIDEDFTFDTTPISYTLSCLKNLTKLVMRGMCTDNMLKSIGQNCHSLSHLDVSGSLKVTDVGIQHLVFRDRSEHSAALYMISSWILKNMNKMNPLMNKLTYLDYSLTSVTTMGRNIFQLMPGCYLFKRLTSNGEDDFGHHIFIQEPELFKSQIPPTATLLFDTELSKHVGTTGAKSFLKMVESHPWKRYFLTLYSYVSETEYDLVAHIAGRTDRTVWGIITPNQNEKRIQGIVQWNNGILTQVYTIYPVNLNLLGSLHTVRSFQGIVHGSWRRQFSLLPDLTQLDIFTEPKTLLSFMQYCPNLKRLTIRIRGAALTDDHIITAIRTSMLRKALEEFWIAPAPTGSTDEVGGGSHVSSLSPSLCASFNSITERIEAEDRAITEFDLAARKLTSNDGLVQLSMNCLKTLVTTCASLKKVGDLASWSNVEEEELYMYCEELKQKRHKILITWANINLPDTSSTKKKRTQM